MEIFGYEIKKKEREPGVIYMSDINKEVDRKIRRDRLKAKAKEVLDKAMEHKAEIVAIGSATAIGVRKLTKFVGNRKEAYDKSHRFYDYSLHRWCETKRPLTKKEDLQYKERLNNGEHPFEILKDMDLLKR